MPVKKAEKEPNYVIQMFCCESDGNIRRFRLADSRWFYSEKEIQEITYWKNGKCFTIEKFDSTEWNWNKEKTKKQKSK